MAAHRRRHRRDLHLRGARREHRPAIGVAEQPVGGALHVHHLVGMRTDAAEQTEAGLDEEWRSEEHTSELQSLMRISYAVFCLKKKKTEHNPSIIPRIPTTTII